MQCYICRVASQRGNKSYIDSGRGHVRQVDIEITPDNGLYGASSNKENISVVTKEEKETINYKICSVCKAEISKGKSHQCSVAKASDNIGVIIEDLPQKHKNQIIHSLLQVNKLNIRVINALQNVT